MNALFPILAGIAGFAGTMYVVRGSDLTLQNPTYSLKLGSPREDKKATESLRRLKALKAKRTGNLFDLNAAVISAAFYAKKYGKTMFVYEGNSYMNRVYQITYKPSEYLSGINNTGTSVISVAPDRTVTWYDVHRG